MPLLLFYELPMIPHTSDPLCLWFLSPCRGSSACMASAAAGFWGSAACCSHSKLSRAGSLKLGRGRSPPSMLSGRRCSGVSGLGGGAVSPGPVVAEVVEPGVGSGAGEASRELFEACRSGDLERVRKLMTAENVNSRDTAGRKSTPLHFAAGETLDVFSLFHRLCNARIKTPVSWTRAQTLVICQRPLSLSVRLPPVNSRLRAVSDFEKLSGDQIN